MSGTDSYHIPVLGEEVCSMLITRPEGIYLDGTLGGGGHFDLLRERLAKEAILIGIDRDNDAVRFNRNRNHNGSARIIIEQCRFSDASIVCAKNGIAALDGILLDLGVSSFQIDTVDRGFSFMKECSLDMRMNGENGPTAAELIGRSTVEELAKILEEYGEIRNALRMANTIKNCASPLTTSTALNECLQCEYGGDLKYKILAKIYMALRIAVNEELLELEKMLEGALSLLGDGGRIGILTYHSLEDRIVKTFFKKHERQCICPTAALMCTCGTPGVLKRVTRKPVIASPEEQEKNSRSRSASLRVAERLPR